MKLVEYGLVPTGLANDAVDVSMTHSLKTSAVQAVEVVFVDACQSVTGSTRSHGVSYADDEWIGSNIDEAYNFSIQVKRVSSPVYLVDEPAWHNHAVTGGSGAYARVVRGIRQIAAGAMLSTGDLFTPSAEYCHYYKDEVEVQQPRSWLHNLHLAEPRVPFPPMRIIESYRVFPPKWEADDDILALDDASFLFVGEHR